MAFIPQTAFSFFRSLSKFSLGFLVRLVLSCARIEAGVTSVLIFRRVTCEGVIFSSLAVSALSFCSSVCSSVFSSSPALRFDRRELVLGVLTASTLLWQCSSSISLIMAPYFLWITSIVFSSVCFCPDHNFVETTFSWRDQNASRLYRKTYTTSLEYNANDSRNMNRLQEPRRVLVHLF